MAYVNGGIQLMVAQIHERGNYGVQLKNVAFILYNMIKADHYDPGIFSKFEEHYKITEQKWLESRHCFGAVYAYYKSNQGSRYGIDFWEAQLDQHMETLHVQEIVALLEAFRCNRQLHRSHMIEKMDT